MHIECKIRKYVSTNDAHIEIQKVSSKRIDTFQTHTLKDVNVILFANYVRSLCGDVARMQPRRLPKVRVLPSSPVQVVAGEG